MSKQVQASEEKKREETPPLRLKKAPTLEIDQIDKSRGKIDQKEKASKGKVNQKGKSKGKGAEDAAQTERKHPPAPSNSTNLNDSRFQRGGSQDVNCCESKRELRSLRSENEKLKSRVKEL